MQLASGGAVRYFSHQQISHYYWTYSGEYSRVKISRCSKVQLTRFHITKLNCCRHCHIWNMNDTQKFVKFFLWSGSHFEPNGLIRYNMLSCRHNTSVEKRFMQVVHMLFG